MKIIKKTSFHNTSIAAGRNIKYIVVHYTAGIKSAKGSAVNTANWFMNPKAGGSADFIVDETEVVQYNPDIEGHYTWHCGGAKYNTKGGGLYGTVTNRNSIGIEMCSRNDMGKITAVNDKHWKLEDTVIKNTEELILYLMKKYAIKPENIVRHYDVNGKPCPGVYGWNADTGSEKEWEAFKKRLGAKTGKTSPSKAVKHTVQVMADSLNVRAGIGTSFPILKSLKHNQKVTVVETSGSWGKVKDSGWINLAYTRRV